MIKTQTVMTPRVLVIDDETGFTQLLKMNLEREGRFHVHVENNSMRALTAAREFKPDVILLDIVMPGMDGGDLAASFSSDPELSKIPVIMVTALVAHGETSPESVVQSSNMTVLPKPVNLGQLMQCIDDVLA